MSLRAIAEKLRSFCVRPGPAVLEPERGTFGDEASARSSNDMVTEVKGTRAAMGRVAELREELLDV